MVTPPAVSWLFFKARAKRPYLNHTGQARIKGIVVFAGFRNELNFRPAWRHQKSRSSSSTMAILFLAAPRQLWSYQPKPEQARQNRVSRHMNKEEFANWPGGPPIRQRQSARGQNRPSKGRMAGANLNLFYLWRTADLGRQFA
jgi:hypothetical protein